MNINNKWFRLSVYQEHLNTGLPPVREFRLTTFHSADHNARQRNFALKLWLMTFFLKLR